MARGRVYKQRGIWRGRVVSLGHTAWTGKGFVDLAHAFEETAHQAHVFSLIDGHPESDQ